MATGVFHKSVSSAVDGGLTPFARRGDVGTRKDRSAIVHLKAERIGHGIRILEDPS